MMVMVENCLWQNSDMKEHPGHFPHEVNNIARCIVMRCEGLPLGINVVVITMKGIHDQRRHTLTNLKWDKS